MSMLAKKEKKNLVILLLLDLVTNSEKPKCNLFLFKNTYNKEKYHISEAGTCEFLARLLDK